jgi:NAD(P)-dependent dehydrogenase (short-subunit alcohol dehydrogenase family)
MRLKNKVAVVTGAGRGIGEAIVLAYAREGANLTLASRTKAELEAVADKASAIGAQAHVVTADVSVEKDVEELVDKVLSRHGRVDVLVNCAGILGPIGPLWKCEPREWIEAIKINLMGTFLCMRAFVSHMVAQRSGKIINLSGGGGAAPLPRFSAYAASKAAVVRLTENLAQEVGEFGVDVNAIAPGLVDTRLQDRVLEAGEDAGEQFSRIRQLRGEGLGGVGPEVAAGLAVFLASKESDGLTGRLIAAPYDGWQKWGAGEISKIASAPWFTLRRIDPLTLKSVTGKDIDS